MHRWPEIRSATLAIFLLLAPACSDTPAELATPSATAAGPSPEQLRDDCEAHQGRAILLLCQNARQMYDLAPRNLGMYAAFRDQVQLAQQRHADAENEATRRNAINGDPIFPESCRVLCERLIRAGMENAARAAIAAGKSDWLE